jgi:hypothetical protein
MQHRLTLRLARGKTAHPAMPTRQAGRPAARPAQAQAQAKPGQAQAQARAQAQAQARPGQTKMANGNPAQIAAKVPTTKSGAANDKIPPFGEVFGNFGACKSNNTVPLKKIHAVVANEASAKDKAEVKSLYAKDKNFRTLAAFPYVVMQHYIECKEHDFGDEKKALFRTGRKRLEDAIPDIKKIQDFSQIPGMEDVKSQAGGSSQCAPRAGGQGAESKSSGHGPAPGQAAHPKGSSPGGPAPAGVPKGLGKNGLKPRPEQKKGPSPAQGGATGNARKAAHAA